MREQVKDGVSTALEGGAEVKRILVRYFLEEISDAK